MEVYTPVTIPDLFTQENYGLLTAVNWVTSTDNKWQTGIAYETDCGAADITIDPCIISGSPSVPVKAATWDPQTRGSRPFYVKAEADCAPVGDWWTTGRERVVRSLAQNVQDQLERVLWTGYAFQQAALIFPNLTTPGPLMDSTNRILLQPSSQLIAGTYDIVEGLGKLEAQLAACYKGGGVIHVPLQLYPALIANFLVTVRGGKLYTYAGNQVVVGSGFDISVVPSGAAITGEAWMMATSPIFGMRGAVKTFDPVQSLDRTVNTVKFIAEQPYILGWTCCRAGVKVSTGGVVTGSPNVST